ncbi:MBL fold metallo-hydrolase, partial [bacterium]|nr:MBL fold metallo-hydrolase [bacterium]
VIVTGCAHSGIINIIKKAQSVMNDDRVYCILGGTHLINTSANRLKLTANYLKKINLTHLYAGHCTGFNSACYLQYELKDVFKPLETGLELSFNF